MKISEFKVGETISVSLLVKEASARATKAGKPFLSLTLGDGFTEISGNYWTWAGKVVPDKGAVLRISAAVAEWQGAKQLNIKVMANDLETPVAVFMPKSDFDLIKVYEEAMNLVDSIDDDFYNSVCREVLEEYRSQFMLIPGAKFVHHAYVGGTLIHSVSVAKIARVMAATIDEASVDLCTSGALLHDLGKLVSYSVNGAIIDITDIGMLEGHIMAGVDMLDLVVQRSFRPISEQNQAKYALLRHVILSHHGEQQYGAIVNPRSIEAYIVSSADRLDANCEQIRVASKAVGDVSTIWTDRIYMLDNAPHVSSIYTENLMSEDIPF